MEFTEKRALKKYKRMRAWRRVGLFLAFAATLVVPTFYGLTRTEAIIFAVGGFLFYVVGELEMRLKTMQIRLAAMDDDLAALRGKNEPSSLVLELNDW